MGWRSWLGFAELDKQHEARSVTAPWVDSVPFNYGGPPSAPTISQHTALSLGSVYSANRLLAQSVSTLPLKAYRRGSDGRVPMNTLPQLFDNLVTDGQLIPWLHRCVTSLGLRGNAYGWIINRDGFGFPTQIDWLDPSVVAVDRTMPLSLTDTGDTYNPAVRGWLVNGRQVPDRDIVHIPLFTIPGHKQGLSPIASFAKTLGIGLQAQNYADDWFAGGGFPPGTFKNSEKHVTQEESEIIKARVVNAIRTHTPLVHGSDWEYQAISVPPEEAQFIETMKMTTSQIAAIYGIPPEMIGGESGSSMTYANVEQQQINFVMFTLRPWLVILEHAFSAILPDKQYVKFNSDALIRADVKTRWEVNQIRHNMGAASIDEIRAQEDEPPLPNGQGQQYGPAPTPVSPNPGDVTPMRRYQ